MPTNPKPTRDEAIAFADQLLRLIKFDYPGGRRGLIADLTCLGVQTVSDVIWRERKKTKLGLQKTK